MKKWCIQPGKRTQVYPKVAKTKNNDVPVTMQPRKPKLPLDILVCTPDATSALTQKCLKSLRETTAHIEYTLYIEDNHGIQPFNHAESINKALDRATGYLVTCDDDVTFTPGWLDSALDIVEADKDVGVVGFTLYDAPNKIWGSGMDTLNDGTVKVDTIHYPYPKDQYAQCSACFLLPPTDMRFDTRYKKYRFESDFCFRMKEAGKRVVVVPNIVFHEKGTQYCLWNDKNKRTSNLSHDRELFCNDWIKTGRLQKLYKDQIRVGTSFDRKGKTVIVTAAVGKGYGASVPLIKRMAQRHGHDFVCIDESWATNETTPHHLKWKINAILEQGYENCLWIDSDTLPKPDCPDIFSVVPVGNLGIFDEHPCLLLQKVDRARTCKDFVENWRKHWGPIEYTYPGYYFNSGVMVFDRTCNPFIPRADGVYCFKNDILKDQTYLNIVTTSFPKTFLEWKWNRLGIIGMHMHLGFSDMLKEAYIPHYCGKNNTKDLLQKDLKKMVPAPNERQEPTSENGLRFLCRCVNERSKIKNMVEVGSAYGESAWIFTEMFPDVFLTCVDNWEGKRYAKAEKEFDRVFNSIPNVRKVKGDSSASSENFEKCSLDFVYIDAAHDYASVKKDIKAWLPKVKPGGFIGGHDYKLQWQGCMRAVNEEFTGPTMVFEDSSWIVPV